ncbi:MAG: Ig-like domain-containing protein [Planctomycetota bacterium]
MVYEIPQGLGSPSGTIEVWLKRTREEAGKHPGGISYESFLELEQVEDGGKILKYMTFSIMWRDENRPGESGLLLYPGETGPWGQWVPLGTKVKIGEWVHLAFTWGPDPGSSAVYVNGSKRPGYADRHNSFPAPSPDFSSFMGDVNRIVIGRDFAGWQPLYDASIGSVVISDVAKQSFDLARMKPVITSVTDDTYQVPGISGKLVAGDTVTATLLAEPGGTATFDMGDVKGIAMEEVPATEGGPGIPAVDNGTYQGRYTIRPGDDYEDGYLVGHFVSADNVAADPVSSVSKWTIDTKPQVTFDIDRKDMPADSSTKARIKLVAKDANGNPVPGRRLKLTLATTDEYTGTVGAGDFGENVGATVETRWRGETDAWGEVEFDYLAGFAAKTVILSAKDLDSGGVTVDYITAYKEAAIDIALTPPVSRAATRRGVQYIVKVEASRTELTADGRSRSVIRAKVMDPNGNPVSGDPVTFALSSENGTLRTIKGTTDSSGVATAEYRAGKKIGIVVVTAAATLRNASGNVSIVLLSDAPAKIYLKARPDTLPADGFSRSDLEVRVTDINDNPNQDTKVEFQVSKGGGKLDYADRLTDRFGDAANRYTSGTTPGVATVVATVRSKVPTEEELAKAKNVLFAPYSPEGDEIRVEKWLKKKGDSFVKGDPLVEYTVGRGSTVYQILAPYDGKMGEQFVEYWDDAEVGQTMAVLIPASK